MKRILIVDQQQNVLDHFRKVLRPLQEELDVRFVSTSNEALLSLGAESYDVDISDAAMAESDGTLC